MPVADFHNKHPRCTTVHSSATRKVLTIAWIFLRVQFREKTEDILSFYYKIMSALCKDLILCNWTKSINNNFNIDFKQVPIWIARRRVNLCDIAVSL